MPPTSALSAILENRKLRVAGPLPETKVFIKAARVIEGLSQISEITVDFMSHDRALKMEDVVGQSHKVRIQKGAVADQWREFIGTCVEASYIGMHEGYSFFSLEIRPWIWFLTKTRNNRIFNKQETATDIIKKIFGDRGFSEYTIRLQRNPEPRVYTVQYDETDYDFICRLMEEEGMYFYSTVKDGKDHLMIVDGASGHSPVESHAEIAFNLREGEYRRRDDHIFEWRGGEGVRSGKITLRDYNFETPRADMTSVSSTPRGKHNFKNFEQYAYPGRFRDTARGSTHARVRMEAEACQHAIGSAVGNVRTLATGATFKLTGHTRDAENAEYLVISAVHMMQIEVQQQDETQDLQRQSGGAPTPDLPGSIKFEDDNKDTYRCTFKTIRKSVPFRAPLKTAWPKIPGILLAKVTGPAGEEIHTDKHYRIKVQFPWDRDGRNDENTTCWVRCVSQWSGKDWGLVSVPRIGQEVVIQFEDGDPDRPICTGMLYNAETMVPNALPGNMTQSGIKTRSSKGGGADNYNELVFEDKKGEEFIRMHSEKDFMLTVENDMTVSIGQTKKDPGNLKTDIHNSRTETIHEGDLTLTVSKGNETRDIKTNRTEKIGADASQEVKGNKKTDVTGNATTTVQGNLETTVTGTTKLSSTGAITIESPASIELKVGGNTIKIDPSGVTINGIMIKTKASAMAEHDGGGMMVVKGGIVMIN